MSKAKVLRISSLLLLLIAVGLGIWQGRNLDVAVIVQWVETQGALAWLTFILLYSLATVLFLPGSILTLAGGSLFGPILGTFINLTGATLGATLAFLVSRYLGSDWVEAKAGGRLKQLKTGVEHEGWRFVAFTRLVPLFPFNLLNYALGLTRIRLSHYFLATYICMLPGALAYTYLGYAGREAIAGGENLIQKALLALALLASVAFLPRLISYFRQGSVWTIEQLQQNLDTQNTLLLLDVRNVDDFQTSHIAQAWNIPLENLNTQLSELTAYQEKPVALICTTDRRSHKAAQILLQQGFTEVHVVLGGMEQWAREQRPVISS